MPRLMSVAFTEDAVLERRKEVTRRKGWQFLLPGDRLTLVRKAMGRKPGEPVVRVAEVEVVSVIREPLYHLLQHHESYGRAEMALEGFPDMDPLEFIERFFVQAQRMSRSDVVTRIRWKYLDLITRPYTAPVKVEGGGTRHVVKRCCNVCDRELGDATTAEIDAAVAGLVLPDVSAECGRH